uniref:Uncharacterized protein n=1 Tax=Lygus hesperus TaxID=30085 RepID=A0A0A9YXW1_LYGHE
MRVHQSVPILLLICSQAVNKDGAEPCTTSSPNPIHGLYIGEFGSSHHCEALSFRRSMFMQSPPDVFCIGNKIFRIIDSPLEGNEFKLIHAECVKKHVCMEDLEEKWGLSSRWMRLTYIDGLLYFNKKPSVVDSTQLEILVGSPASV